MTNLQTLFDSIEKLSPDELEQLQHFVEARHERSGAIKETKDDVENRIAGLHEALAHFREGLSGRELQNLVQAMNISSAFPLKDAAMYDWLDKLSEDEL